MQLKRLIDPRGKLVLERLGGKSTLLVDPDPQECEDLREKLARAGSPVQTAATLYEVFGLQLDEEPSFTVLSDALGDYHLSAVSEYARHRWPRTQVVVMGKEKEEGPGRAHEYALAGC